MNAFHHYNQKPDDALKQINTYLADNERYYKTLQVRCVCVEQEGLWINVLCFATASPREIPTVVGGSRRYRDAHLLEGLTEISEGVARLLREVATGRIVVDGETITTNRSEFHEWDQLPSRNDYTKSPGYLFNTGYPPSLPIKPLVMQAPLLDFALPNYPDVYQATQDWIGLREVYGPSDARIGMIYLLLPECRAQFGQLETNNGHLRISVVPGVHDSDREFRLNGSWKTPVGISHISSPVSGALDVQIEIPDGATECDLYLMDRAGGVFDYHHETPFLNLGQERILPVSAGDTAAELSEIALPYGLTEIPIRQLSAEHRVRSDTDRDEIVANRLRKLDPALADSYEQVIRDIKDKERITYRGTAAEMREVLTGVLHGLAPDADVQATDWYREARKTGAKKETTPTRAERAKFILRGKGLGSADAEVSESYTSLIEERLGKVVDATYRKGAAATHSGADREDVLKSLHYMNALLRDLLPKYD